MSLQGQKVYAVVDNDLYDGTNGMVIYANREDAEKELEKEFQELKAQYEDCWDHRNTGDFASKDSMIELGDDLENNICDRYLEIQELIIK